MRTFPEVRARAYRGARGFAVILATILAIMLAAMAVLVLGQAAVLWPALRAAAIPPPLATRSG